MLSPWHLTWRRIADLSTFAKNERRNRREQHAHRGIGTNLASLTGVTFPTQRLCSFLRWPK
jgi:phage protein U